MWNIEDTGYSLDELTEGMHSALEKQGLPSDKILLMILQKVQPGLIEVVYTSKKPILYLSYTVDFNMHSSQDSSIIVNPRRQGYGRKLVHASEEFCRSVGVNIIYLTNVMPGSEAFWNEMGYINNRKRL
jgi:GNAT superfamily N-acetyltransferase